uniref:tRNA (Cytosine(38)-C(5))-methyltransferase n=1 Tax=Steinernema glaseri TaxID=37863 RepID=A0A1I8AHG9_9BILA
MDADLLQASEGPSYVESESPRLRCLEFFCGIGGFHVALRRVCNNIDVVGAFDINTTTNRIYKFNFPDTPLFERNIQALTVKSLDRQDADIWAMSPPCQPFVKRGLQLDLKDPRCAALKHLCDCICEMKNPPRFVIVENVPGFQNSAAEEMLIQALDDRGYQHKVSIENPWNHGIPNSRPRYFLTAKLGANRVLPKKLVNRWVTELPRTIGDILSPNSDACNDLFLSTEFIMRHMDVIDIVEPRSFNSNCFTKAYGSYVKGAGSYLVTNVPKDHGILEFGKIHLLRLGTGNNKMEAVKNLKIRAFSVGEICRLMGFNDELMQPPDITRIQMYKCLGNSVNIFNVCNLLTHLLFDSWAV